MMMKKKKTTYLLGIALVAGALVATLTACNEDDEPAAKVRPERIGTFTDIRDGEQYGYVTYGGLDWMTENMRYDIHDDVNSTIYLDSDENGGSSGGSNPGSTRNLARYGRLYTLKGAHMACPDGWRLPTDADWQRLEQALGMAPGDTARDGWRGDIAPSMVSVYDDKTDLNMLLGGYFFLHRGVGGDWLYMGVYGYYWTDTADDDKGGEYYFVRKMTYNRREVCRMSMEPTSYKLSVRYVREAD